jgi:hypothetical protein
VWPTGWDTAVLPQSGSHQFFILPNTPMIPIVSSSSNSDDDDTMTSLSSSRQTLRLVYSGNVAGGDRAIRCNASFPPCLAHGRHPNPIFTMTSLYTPSIIHSWSRHDTHQSSSELPLPQQLAGKRRRRRDGDNGENGAAPVAMAAWQAWMANMARDRGTTQLLDVLRSTLNDRSTGGDDDDNDNDIRAPIMDDEGFMTFPVAHDSKQPVASPTTDTTSSSSSSVQSTRAIKRTRDSKDNATSSESKALLDDNVENGNDDTNTKTAAEEGSDIKRFRKSVDDQPNSTDEASLPPNEETPSTAQLMVWLGHVAYYEVTIEASLTEAELVACGLPVDGPLNGDWRARAIAAAELVRTQLPPPRHRTAVGGGGGGDSSSEEDTSEMQHEFDRREAAAAARRAAAPQCIAIGLGTEKFPLTSRQPGWDANSYGYHGDDGRIFHRQGTSAIDYGPSFGIFIILPHPSSTIDTNSCGRYYWMMIGAGDTVGCGLDYFTNSIFFTHNGRHLGVAFQHVSGAFYPVVGVDATWPLRINLGEQPFKFDLAR